MGLKSVLSNNQIIFTRHINSYVDLMTMQAFLSDWILFNNQLASRNQDENNFVSHCHRLFNFSDTRPRSIWSATLAKFRWRLHRWREPKKQIQNWRHRRLSGTFLWSEQFWCGQEDGRPHGQHLLQRRLHPGELPRGLGWPGRVSWPGLSGGKV